MFDTIKNSVISDDTMELMVENATDADIRDAFLDDPEIAAVGGENDPEIAKFIETIPEDDEVEPVTQEDIEKIEEAAYGLESDSAISDSITSGNYNEFDDELPAPMPDPEIDDCHYNDESDDKIIDRITSESFNEFDDEL